LKKISSGGEVPKDPDQKMISTILRFGRVVSLRKSEEF